MRKAAGLTGDQLAAALGWGPKSGPTKISKIENGRQMPSAADIRAWANATGYAEEAGELLDLLADLERVHMRRRRMLRGGEAPLQEDYDQRTRAAKHFRNMEIAFIPGLLQTSAYARSIIMQVSAVYGITDIDVAVQARMRRQDILYDTSKVFEFLITEAALRLRPCPVQVMLGQLDRLLGLGLDNVTLGIIPFGPELTITPVNGFLLLDDRLIIETYSGEDQEHGDESAIHHRIFDTFMSNALTGDEARRLIMAAAASLRNAANALAAGGTMHPQTPRYNFMCTTTRSAVNCTHSMQGVPVPR
jgi:transcriptional regulator with XRE-family HTH domain